MRWWIKLLISIWSKGPQPFEYFGASLASIDLDGDGADELVVGSPLYSSHNVVQQSSSSTVCCNDDLIIWIHTTIDYSCSMFRIK